jgi:hypothetical protein
LVIIWLKRCPARSLIDPALEPGTIVGGAWVLGVEVGLGDGNGDGDAAGVGDGLGVGVGVEHSMQSLSGVGEGDCAHDDDDGAPNSESVAMAASTIDKVRPRSFAMVSARTAYRWDRCRHRR